jgi:hypothetical protein
MSLSLSEIREVCEKAIPGPYHAAKFNDTKAHSIYADGIPRSIATVRAETLEQQAATATMFAISPRELPRLVGVLEKVRLIIACRCDRYGHPESPWNCGKNCPAYNEDCEAYINIAQAFREAGLQP